MAEFCPLEGVAMIDIEFWKNKKVFVTGHTGFKGSWLSILLDKLGCTVFGYSLAPQVSPSLFEHIYPFLGKSFAHHLDDICNFSSLKSSLLSFRPDVCIHLAAQPLVRQSYCDPVHTWDVNVRGTINLLESLRSIDNKCAVVCITTDKVYLNSEVTHGYRETDSLGGFDPYSSSKAAAELAISSWRSSFCGTKDLQTPFLRIASARAGNVVGGGDWSKDRIIGDCIKSLSSNTTLTIRNPNAKRPWQHVLESLSGYLMLAEYLYKSDNPLCEAYNIGPSVQSNRTVSDLVKEISCHWSPLDVEFNTTCNSLHEATLLHLQSDKIYNTIGWTPRWDFQTTIQKTILWYKNFYKGQSPFDLCSSDINTFFNALQFSAT